MADFSAIARKVERTVKQGIDRGDEQIGEMQDLLDTAKAVVQGDIKPGVKSLADALKESGAPDAWRRSRKAAVKVGDLVGASKQRTVKRERMRRKFMETGGNFDGRVEDRMDAGLQERPPRMRHVRELMTVQPTNEGILRYVQETGYTRGQTGPVGEGETIAEDEILLREVEDGAEKVAVLIRVTEEMLRDPMFLALYLETRMAEELRKSEDEGILYGSGGQGEHRGILTYDETLFDPEHFTAAVDAGDLQSPQRIDVLRFAILQARKANVNVDTALLNPLDMALLESVKDEDGRYLDEIERLNVDVFESNAVDVGDFVVGDFGSGLTTVLLERQAPTINLYQQDRDNVPRDLVTLRVLERFILPVFRPEGIVHGTFDSALNPES